MNKIPTLSELYASSISFLQTKLNVTIPTTGKSFLRGIAGSWAGLLNSAYRFLGGVQKNSWYTTADPDQLPRWGMSFLKRLPRPATQGSYTFVIMGTIGATIQANTTFLSSPESSSPNYLFILDSDHVFTTNGAETMTLRATTAGTIAALAVDDQLTATKPLIGVNQSGNVIAILVSPIDAETAEEYRTAIDNQVRLAPQGGSVADYILWSGEAAGVKRVYPYTKSGSVWEQDVYIEAVLSDSGGSAPDYNYGIPTLTILTDATNDILTDPITSIARKPMGVILGPSNSGAIAVTVYQVAITFTGSTGISSDDQALIKAALREAVSNIRPFIPGADDLADQNDTISIGLPATIGSLAPPEKYVVVVIAMQAAPGAVFTGVTMTVNAVSQTAYTFDNGIIPYLTEANILFT